MASWRPALVAAILAALFALIYFPDLGHGFLTDDFHWIAVARIQSAGDVARIFSSNTGFYRPLVTLSFAADTALWGLDARGFALTNLLLLAMDAALIFALARQLALPAEAALFAAAIWAFNFHGINMALLWTSGRTALLLCAFALATVLASLRGHHRVSGLFAFAAMLCKEEAVMLPLLLAAIAYTDGRRSRQAIAMTATAWGALVIYAALRLHSGAFGPLSAPPFYRLTLEPRALLQNATQYLDRGATWPVAAAIVITLAARPVVAFDEDEWRVVRIGALWFAAMYAITVLVVVRSSLYAVAPSIGSALAAAAFAARAWRTRRRAAHVAAAALIVIAAAALPIYRARNAAFVAAADLSTRALDVIGRTRPGDHDVASIVLIDDPRASVTLRNAFGSLLPDALQLFVDPRVDGEIVAAGDAVPHRDRMLVFELTGGDLRQVP